MVLSLGVKNMFGAVVAQRKAEWHYKVGLRREVFASLLIDICMGLKPSFTILDGVWGMEGRGPANGNPRNFSLLAGAENPLTLDFHICRMLGLPMPEFPLWQAAKLRNLPETEIMDSDLEGDYHHPFRFENVDIPKLSSLRVMPRIPFIEPLFTSKPVQDVKKCIQCLRCIEICPAHAIGMNKDGVKLDIDYKKCIRCYCCHEFCPKDAIDFKDGLILKFMKLLGK
jgi:ferredoxin